MSASNNLDKIIFLLAIFSNLNASNYNRIRSNALHIINWYNCSRKTRLYSAHHKNNTIKQQINSSNKTIKFHSENDNVKIELNFNI